MRARTARTAPTISATTSPRTRIAITRPEICAGVAAPDMMIENASSASCSVNSAPVATLAISGFRVPS